MSLLKETSLANRRIRTSENFFVPVTAWHIVRKSGEPNQQMVIFSSTIHRISILTPWLCTSKGSSAAPVSSAKKPIVKALAVLEVVNNSLSHAERL
jgi:hypothetical protein